MGYRYQKRVGAVGRGPGGNLLVRALGLGFLLVQEGPAALVEMLKAEGLEPRLQPGSCWTALHPSRK